MGQGGRLSNSGGFAVWMDAWDHRDILSPGGKSARDTIFWLVVSLQPECVSSLSMGTLPVCLQCILSPWTQVRHIVGVQERVWMHTKWIVDAPESEAAAFCVLGFVLTT